MSAINAYEEHSDENKQSAEKDEDSGLREGEDRVVDCKMDHRDDYPAPPRAGSPTPMKQITSNMKSMAVTCDRLGEGGVENDGVSGQESGDVIDMRVFNTTLAGSRSKAGELYRQLLQR